MDALNSSIVHEIVGGIGLVLSYGLAFWRIFKGNPQNRVIECGSITLMLFVVVMALSRIPNLPTWILGDLFFLAFLLCLLTIGFLAQQGYRALRRRRMQ